MAIVLGSGCFEKPANLTNRTADAATDGAGAADAPAALCDVPFSPMVPLRLGELDGAATGEPTITGDGLDLYWMLQTSGSNYEIHHADRAAVGNSFTTRGRFTPAPIEATDQDPSISADGDLLVYRGQPGAAPKAYFLTRTAGTWSTPALLPGLEAEVVSSLDLSPDGLTLYFNNGSNNLRRATSASRGAPFVVDPTGLGANFSFAAVSADGREVYYASSGGISRVLRPDTAFGWQMSSMTQVLTEGFDPELSPDGESLYVANGIGISVATRDCP